MSSACMVRARPSSSTGSGSAPAATVPIAARIRPSAPSEIDRRGSGRGEALEVGLDGLAPGGGRLRVTLPRPPAPRRTRRRHRSPERRARPCPGWRPPPPRTRRGAASPRRPAGPADRAAPAPRRATEDRVRRRNPGVHRSPRSRQAFHAGGIEAPSPPGRGENAGQALHPSDRREIALPRQCVHIGSRGMSRYHREASMIRPASVSAPFHRSRHAMQPVDTLIEARWVASGRAARRGAGPPRRRRRRRPNQGNTTARGGTFGLPAQPGRGARRACAPARTRQRPHPCGA